MDQIFTKQEVKLTEIIKSQDDEKINISHVNKDDNNTGDFKGFSFK